MKRISWELFLNRETEADNTAGIHSSLALYFVGNKGKGFAAEVPGAVAGSLFTEPLQRDN